MVDAQFNFNLFDAFVFATLVIAAGISLYRGFIREFLSLATWVGAGLITLSLSEKSTAFMAQYMTSAFGAAVIGILGTYFFVVILLSMLSKVLLRYVRDGAEVGWPDHVLGLVFGFFKGGLVVVLGFILMTLVFREDGYPEWVQNASTLPVVQSAAVSIVRAMPEELGTISSLGEPTDSDIAQIEEEAQREATINQGIRNDIADQQPVLEENTASASALEQLIMDVTKDKQEQF